MAAAVEQREPHVRRAVRALGVAVGLGALLANEVVLARLLSPDGGLESGTRWTVRGAQALALTVGAFLALRPGAAATAWRRLDPFAVERTGALRRLLVLGIALRVALFFLLAPRNNDPHWEFVRFLVDRGRLPLADELILGFQPPLYYLLAAPLAALGSIGLVQLLSLLLSVLNLVWIGREVRTTALLSSHAARCHAFLLTPILPQLLIFSGFVSNDALAYPLGTLTLLLAFRYFERPTTRRVALLGVVQGLSLATKGTLIANLPVLAGAIALVEWRRGEHGRVARVLRAGAVFGALTTLFGCYKFVENQVHFGTPVISNDVLEQEWVALQAGTYVGPSTFYDVNVLELARDPVVGEHTRHSIPLLLYGTFWGTLFPESNLNRTRAHPWKVVPRALYLAAVVPTALILVGLWSGLARGLAGCLSGRRFEEHLQALVAIASLAGAVALVVRWGLAHDAWSFFQARLVFPAFLAIALGLGWGVEWLERRPAFPRLVVGVGLAATYALCLLYLAIELGAQLATPTDWPPAP